MDTSKVTRLEVIGYPVDAHKNVIRWTHREIKSGVEINLQDDGRTLKIFFRDGS